MPHLDSFRVSRHQLVCYTRCMEALQDTSSATNAPGMSLSDIASVADNVSSFIEAARRRIFAPDARKKPPSYNMAQLAAVCGIGRAAVCKRVANSDDNLPKGSGHGQQRRFGLDEVRAWARHYGVSYRRLPSQPGCKLVVANFKGGVSKTTTAAHVAQGLALRGYEVLMIDLDAQGSLTSMFGISPEFEVESSDTVVALASGETDSLGNCIRRTYWPGIDIVPGSVALNGADFFLPARQARDPRFAFWAVLDAALQRDGLLYRYDYIIIDTPPAISYLTINAFWTADALLVPMPPEGPDFVSSSQFWALFAQMSQGIEQRVLSQNGKPKRYSWVRVVPAKVDRQRSHTEVMLQWMKTAYKDLLLDVELPMTSAVGVSGVQMGTVYDIERYVGAARTYERARLAYDTLLQHVDQLTRAHHWGVS